MKKSIRKYTKNISRQLLRYILKLRRERELRLLMIAYELDRLEIPAPKKAIKENEETDEEVCLWLFRSLT